MASPAYRHLMDDLARGDVILIDGATGTELEKRGAAMHENAWCAAANLSAVDILEAIHRDYIGTKARLITTNTFSTNRLMLNPAGLGDQFELLNQRAVQTALEARAKESAQDRVVVAGSMSHQVPFKNDTTGNVTFRATPDLEAAKNYFQEMAETLAANGVEMILLEMMSTPALANLAIEAARSTNLPFFVGFSMRSLGEGDQSRLVCFTFDDISADQMLRDIDFADAGAIGIMHSHVNLTGDAIELLRQHFDGPLMAYPDSGYFVMPNWQFENVISPADLCTAANDWVARGAQLIGGCCGLSLEHMEHLAAHFD